MDDDKIKRIEYRFQQVIHMFNSEILCVKFTKSRNHQKASFTNPNAL